MNDDRAVTGARQGRTADGLAVASQGGALSRQSTDRRLTVDGRATTNRTRLVIPKGMPIGAWRNLGRQIHVISDSSAWWLGDWLIYGQVEYPDRYKHAIAETSLDYQTLRNYAWVVRRFPPARRREKLSFQHHAEVASFPDKEQDVWLTRAEVHEWSRNELRRQIQGRRLNGRAAHEVVQLNVNLPADRRRRWQEAADRADTDLLSWIVSTVDQAASSLLETSSALH